jgi:hypothetical protein
MDMSVALMASISAVSGGTGVVVAALALRRQKRQGLVDVIAAAVQQHQNECPVVGELNEDAERNRKETMGALESVRNEVRLGLQNVNLRLDTIYVLVGKGKT